MPSLAGIFALRRVSPFVVRNYRYEFLSVGLMAAALACVDVKVLGVLAAKAFEAGPWVITFIAASDAIANVTSVLWSRWLHGTDRVRSANILQFCVIACVIGIALTPFGGWGVLMLAALAVLAAALAALESHGVKHFRDPADLARQTAATLKVLPTGGNTLTLEYTHTDKELVNFLLKSVATAYRPMQLTEDRQLARTGETRVTQAELRDPAPVVDRTLEMFGIILGAAVGVALFLFIAVRMWLRRTARVFDPAAEVLQGLDDKHWPAVEEAEKQAA